MLSKLYTNTFRRDIAILLVISILIGSILSASVSYAANIYFSKALASLVGEYGEYDIVIQSREEVKDETAAHIQKIINETFPGAKMKEGPTLTGKTSFFVALPEQYKTKKTFEDLSKTFGSIPGGAGVGVMIEPRLTIRGVPEGAKAMLMERIEAMDGVRFTFRDGASIAVILWSIDKTSPVSEQIKNFMKEYQVMEISFPVGAEPANPIKTGETVATELAAKSGFAQNVSVDGKNDDMTYMVSTMMELKRFLASYASQVTIASSQQLVVGDILVLQGKAAGPLVQGAAPDKLNVLVQITAIKSGGAEGQIIQGDTSYLTDLQAYKLEKNLVGSFAGVITVKNPRMELSNALTETSKLVGNIPGFAQDTTNMSNIALNALNNYSRGLSAVETTLNGMESAGESVQKATSILAGIDTSSVQAKLDSTSRSLGGLIGPLQVLRLVSPEAGSAVNTLTVARDNLNQLNGQLYALDNVADTAQKAQNAVDNVVNSGYNTLAALRSFDAAGAQNNLVSINQRMAALQQLNVPLITSQLQYMSAAAPNLKDEEIYHSITLLDKFIAGQVIPAARIQVLTNSSVNPDMVKPIVDSVVGHTNSSVYSTAMGMIEPNARGELYQILKEVRAILAGMTAIILTILFLVLDHTAIMSVMRYKQTVGMVPFSGLRLWKQRLKNKLFAPDRAYGMGMGAVFLTAMFILAGGGLPYLPWLGVPVLGAGLGFIVACYASKISPISKEEIMAGEALGLSVDQIMREIMVPGGRPGLMQQLNKRKQKFR